MADLNQMLSDPGVGPGNTMQAEAMRRILHAALFAGAVGVAGRTLQGAGHFLGRNFGGPAKAPFHQSTINIPIKVDHVPKKPTAGRRGHAPKLAGLAQDFSQHLTHAMGLMKAPGEAKSSLGQLVSGWGSSAPKDMPWAYPVGAAAIGGGLYGGYKLTDWLLDKTRKNESDSELEHAKRRYEEAMTGQYGQKAASTDPVDELYEKTAGWTGPLVGAGLLGMGTIGLASGVGAYNWARSHSKTKALEEAIRRRQDALFAQAPRPIMAIPTPYRGGRPAMPGEEDDDEALGKAAALSMAADQVLQRFQQKKQQAAAQWQALINGPPKNSGKSQSREPQPPKLPTLAGAVGVPAG